VVSVSTHNPLPSLDMPGVLVKNKISEYNAELELDVSKLELNKFIDYINKNSTINDLLVQSLPIEDVIKDLYS